MARKQNNGYTNAIIIIISALCMALLQLWHFKDYSTKLLMFINQYNAHHYLHRPHARLWCVKSHSMVIVEFL